GGEVKNLLDLVDPVGATPVFDQWSGIGDCTYVDGRGGPCRNDVRRIPAVEGADRCSLSAEHFVLTQWGGGQSRAERRCETHHRVDAALRCRAMSRPAVRDQPEPGG